MAGLDELWACIWQISWQSAVLAAVVLAINLLMRRAMPASWRCALWLLVAVRLIVPMLPGSPWSIFNLLQPRETMPVLIHPMGYTTVTVRYGPISFGRGQPTEPTLPAVHHNGWLMAGTAIWLLGIFILLGRQIVNERRGNVMLRNMPWITDARVLEMVERCRRKMRLWRRVQAVSSTSARTPAICGVWRTTLILPAENDLSEIELQMVILHELAHVRRFDLQIDRLLSILRAVHWFNPMAWLMVRHWRSEREMACDEVVLRIVGENQRTEYGRVILDMVERFSNLRCAAGAVGLFESQSSLRSRIFAIGRFKRSRFPSVIGLLVLLGITASMLTDAKAYNTTVPATIVGTPQDQAGMVARVYDLSDLVVQNMRAVPFSNVPLSDLDNPPKIPSAKEIADRHEQFIQEIVQAAYGFAPANSWKKNGGKGTITQISGSDQIVIAQTVPNHEKIGAWLSNWHHAAAMQVNFIAHFITLPRGTHIQTTKFTSIGDGGAAYLDDLDVKEILATVHDKKGAEVATPRVTVFDHEDAYIAIETQTSYVGGIIETNQLGPAHYKAQTSVVKTGVLLEVLPTIISDQKHIIVKFHARDKRLLELKEVLWMNNPHLHIQKPIVDTHDAQIIFSIPNASTLLLGLKDMGAQSSDHSVWLLLRPTIIDPSQFKSSQTGRVLHGTDAVAPGV